MKILTSTYQLVEKFVSLEMDKNLKSVSNEEFLIELNNLLNQISYNFEIIQDKNLNIIVTMTENITEFFPLLNITNLAMSLSRKISRIEIYEDSLDKGRNLPYEVFLDLYFGYENFIRFKKIKLIIENKHD